MQNLSPARLYALVFGTVLVAAGIIGFFYESTFTDDESVRDAVFGILDVNGWHNVVHPQHRAREYGGQRPASVDRPGRPRSGGRHTRGGSRRGAHRVRGSPGGSPPRDTGTPIPEVSAGRDLSDSRTSRRSRCARRALRFSRRVRRRSVSLGISYETPPRATNSAR